MQKILSCILVLFALAGCDGEKGPVSETGSRSTVSDGGRQSRDAGEYADAADKENAESENAMTEQSDDSKSAETSSSATSTAPETVDENEPAEESRAPVAAESDSEDPEADEHDVDPVDQANVAAQEGPEHPEEAEESATEDSKGPTIGLVPDDESKTNPIHEFMYFVPLISPNRVVRTISEGNTQTGTIIEVSRRKEGQSFTCECIFNMGGSGRQSYLFDPNDMIERNLADHEKGEPLSKMLEYIIFEGRGQGRMVTKGRVADGETVVESVDVHFTNDESDTSPVTIQLYDIKPEDGRYEYENASSRIVGRVKVLSFQRDSSAEPKMGIKVDSIRNKGDKENWWARFKGSIANMFIPPLKVTKLGNETMLDFGLAVYEGRETFTFPKAENLVKASSE